MDREIPAFNQLVVNKIQQKNLQSHYQRLYSIKSQHSRLYPASTHHSRHNRKAVQLQEEKQTQIQRNNVALFNKMMKIMKRNDPCNQPANSNNRPHSRPNTELSRIQEQNRTMYERLGKQKPTIDHRKLQEQRKKQQNILRFLGKYSAHSLQNTQSHSFRSSQVERASIKGQGIKPSHYLQKQQISTPVQMMARPRYDSSEFDEQINDERQLRAHLQRDSRAKKAYSSTFQTNPKRQEPMSRLRTRQTPLSAKDIILFKTHKVFNDEPWQICIIRSHQAYQIRALGSRNGERHQLKLTLNEQEGNQLLETTNYNYKEIVNRLVINEDQIELVEFEDNFKEKEEYPAETSSFEPEQLATAPKKLIHHYNPSHISQQNEEESFRPNESIHQTFSPEKRRDSLGSEAEQEHPQLTQQKPQEKGQLEQIVENESGLQSIQNAQETPKNAEHETAIQHKLDGNEIGYYEQALDEQIL